MKTVSVYRTSDNKVFDREGLAVKHQIDLLGELLDDFLPHDDRGNVTQSDRFNILIKQLKDNQLFKKIEELANVVSYMKQCDILVDVVNKEASKT